VQDTNYVLNRGVAVAYITTEFTAMTKMLQLYYFDANQSKFADNYIDNLYLRNWSKHKYSLLNMSFSVDPFYSTIELLKATDVSINSATDIETVYT